MRRSSSKTDCLRSTLFDSCMQFLDYVAFNVAAISQKSICCLLQRVRRQARAPYITHASRVADGSFHLSTPEFAKKRGGLAFMQAAEGSPVHYPFEQLRNTRLGNGGFM